MTHAVATADLVARRVRLRARRLALWMESLWRQDRTSPDQGLAITSGEVGRLLAEPDVEAQERARFHADHGDAGLAEDIEQADAALAADPLWRRLCQAFELSQAGADLVCLAAAESIDVELSRAIAYLNDDVRQSRASLRLAWRLFDQAGRPAPEVLAPLLRWRLIIPEQAADGWRIDAGWKADPAVWLSLRAGAWRDPEIESCVVRIDPARALSLPVLYPAALGRLKALAETAASGWVDLLGTEGSGRRTLAVQAAMAAASPVLAIRCRGLAANGQAPADGVTAALRWARFDGAICCWLDAGAIAAKDWPLEAPDGLSIRCGPPGGLDGSKADAIRLPPLSIGDRIVAWSRHSGSAPPPILAVQRLTPGEIAAAAAADPHDPAAIRNAVRRDAPKASELLSPLPCPYHWPDLILTPDVAQQLREFEGQVRLRWTVLEEWGFERLLHLGAGVAALFAGPSGAGKTMAAQVLAASLELDLYRVDLAGVVNKYVGETEKRLRDVFDVCERAGVLLYFDEADALFGQRTQVKDAHDRFANIEIDYLLQRIERFDGVAILSTNRKNDLDTAFMRRLRFVIDFMPPGAEEREIIWRRALPERSPQGEVIVNGIDFQLLAERLHQMTGADIKASALGAAFLARAEGEQIGMRHVLAAAQREIAKKGLVLRAPLREARS